MTGGLRIRELLQERYYSGNETMHPPYPSNSGPNPPGPRQSSYFSRSFNSNVVVVMAVLLFALVVAAFINTVARCFLRRRRPQHMEDHSNADKGLDKSVIEALPVVAYGAQPLSKSFLDPAGGSGSECVVCLSEFTAGEKLRLLPDCHHGFHLGCIDTWLHTHTTCPVCRRSVLPTDSPRCDDSSDVDDSACATAQAVAGGSARFGSSRFGSARIASVVDIEIEGPSSTDPGSASSSSRPKWSFGSTRPSGSVV